MVLAPTPARTVAFDGSLLGATREFGPELLAHAKTAMVFGLVVISAVMFTVMRDRADLSKTQMLVWNDPKVEPVVPEPEPEKIAKVEPPKPVVSKAKPKPPEPKVAKVKPKPPPKPKRKPKPPPMPKLEQPKAQLAKAKPVARPKPKPAARPKPKIEMAALNQPKATEVARQSRQRVEAQSRAHKAKPLPTPAMSSVALAPETESRSARTQRVAARTNDRSKPAPVLAMAASNPSLPSEEAPRATRRSATPFAAARTKSRPNVQVAAATAAIPVTTESTSVARSARVNAPVQATTRGRRSADDLGLAPAALAPAAPERQPTATPTPSRVARAEAPSAPSRGGDAREGMRGVPLGSLASCVSDRQEDLLKQQVLAAVRNREACVSSHGTYRFVETKNLNAFSMWIERAAGRPASDRCAELTHALACLE